MTQENLRQPPRGFQAWFSRMPIYFCKVGLGGLFKERFLLLTHTGRKSGLARKAVLEVVDKDSENYYIVSGFGEKSQWFKNIMHTPQVNIQVGQKKMNALAERLPANDGFRVLENYAKAHPKALKELSRLMGVSYDGSKKDLEKMATILPVLALHIQEKE
ncbi:MAG: nitroreductase family deazaflavin-dependent oxidoreductase [Chloroflexi bacterium]|nr:nitroreductase family deazaflavin-dependent oxidoreductase [Chloroflexota bacterium]